MSNEPVVLDGVDAVRAAVGREFGPTDWLAIDQDRIDGFAEVTGDHQWIHVDPERAKDGPFGTTIAHGYLTLSLVNFFLPQLVTVEGISMGINYGLDKVRFPAPVPEGTRIRASGTLTNVDEVNGGVQTTLVVTVAGEGQSKPACVAEVLSRWIE